MTDKTNQAKGHRQESKLMTDNKKQTNGMILKISNEYKHFMCGWHFVHKFLLSMDYGHNQYDDILCTNF